MSVICESKRLHNGVACRRRWRALQHDYSSSRSAGKGRPMSLRVAVRFASRPAHRRDATLRGLATVTPVALFIELKRVVATFIFCASNCGELFLPCSVFG